MRGMVSGREGIDGGGGVPRVGGGDSTENTGFGAVGRGGGGGDETKALIL
jgi:hypothetical protein